jgi:catechol 2,3-dioxygenase-like lactoylglutathione lyase family enzyme
MTLTVTDVQRSHDFYASLLGFQKIAELGPRVLMSNGSMILALAPASNSTDRFDENRVGLDHLSFTVTNRDELKRAVQLCDDKGVRHGDITNLSDFKIDVLMLRDPDDIQIELTAPYN